MPIAPIGAYPVDDVHDERLVRQSLFQGGRVPAVTRGANDGASPAFDGSGPRQASESTQPSAHRPRLARMIVIGTIAFSR